nr:MAG TPA: protein of unknown function (DUF4969) [Caudoviricetes sp.]
MRSLLNIGVHIQSPAEGLFLLPKLMPSVQSKSVCMGNTSKLLPIRINHHPPGRWFSFAHFYRKERTMKKILLALALAASILLCGCSSEAEKANYNISKQADYFESERKITVYNARTDKVIMEAEGYMSISNNSNNELVCTVKVGPDSYRKNYIYLNDYTMYVVEDITGTHTDPYHYKLYFHTDILPSVETKP